MINQASKRITRKLKILYLQRAFLGGPIERLDKIFNVSYLGQFACPV